MANICDTEYKVVGTKKSVSDLWDILQEFEVNKNDVDLCRIAEHYGIDYQKTGMSVRGHIYWAEYEEGKDEDYALLSFNTESAWSACDLFFEALNEILDNELSISWREVEPGCDIFYVHDEKDFFPEDCYVTANGENFEDCEGVYSTIGDAIKIWCKRTGLSQNGRTDQEMVDFINDYEYDVDDTGFCINIFTFI